MKTYALFAVLMLAAACGQRVECDNKDHTCDRLIAQDGKNGATGATGPTGATCEITTSTDQKWLTCNGQTIEVIDGSDGLDGQDGTDSTTSEVDLNQFFRDRIGSAPKVSIIRVDNVSGNEVSYEGHGSGIIVAQNVVATNYHVCAPLDTLISASEGSHYAMKVEFPRQNVGGATQYFEVTNVTTQYYPMTNRDFCLLKVNTGNRKVYPMTPRAEMSTLDEVISFGYPLEFEFVASHGFVESFAEGIYPWIDADTKIMMISNLIDAGNSGGASFSVKTGGIACVNFGVYMGYQTHAHCLNMDPIIFLGNLTALTFKDGLNNVIDVNTANKTQILTGSGYLDNPDVCDYFCAFDRDGYTVNLVANEVYFVDTTWQTPSTDPIEGTWVAVIDPQGNWIGGGYYDNTFMKTLFRAEMSGTYTIYVETNYWDDHGFYVMRTYRIDSGTPPPPPTSDYYVGNISETYLYPKAPTSTLTYFVTNISQSWSTNSVVWGASYSSVYNDTNGLELVLSNGPLGNGTWLDQDWKDGNDSPNPDLVYYEIAECGMTWLITRQSLLLPNGSPDAFNFAYRRHVYDVDHNGVVDPGSCILESNNGTVIPPE